MNKSLLYFILTIGAVTSFVSCQKQDETTSLRESSSSKPSVAIAPLIDSSENPFNWDISDEITYCLGSRLVQKNNLLITNPQKTKHQFKKVAHSPFGTDLSWVKNTLPEEDFVVFMELIEHKENLADATPQTRPESLSAELKMALRLKILDLRGEEPRIVLQEIIQDSHFIPRQFTSYNCDQAPWNSEEFSLSPVGIAHSLLVKELTSRVEDYISFAKTKK